MTYEEAQALIREHTDYGGHVDVHALATALAESDKQEPIAYLRRDDLGNYETVDSHIEGAFPVCAIITEMNK